jgi:hypothetical protein
VRIVRDDGQFDRREAPQYDPDVPRETPMTAKEPEPMHFYLYSVREKRRISDVFDDEAKLWAYIGSNGYCTDEIDREDADPRSVLKADYEIHESDVNGERIGAIARPRIAGRS